jgi:23S rRNA (cytosine1962-C5)-methyltransferase
LSTGTVTLNRGREKPVVRRHPWIFSGAIDLAEGDPGGLVDVRDSGGGFLARGYYNPRSQIAVRILTWDDSERIDTDWWRSRLETAIVARAAWAGREKLSAYRLVYAESDGLPGLIVDRYGEWLVLQSLTAGIEALKPTLVEHLVDLLHPKGVYERSDADVRGKEGLPNAVGVLWGDSPPDPLVIEEHGLKYLVDILGGHKTGFYLDQRDSRRWLIDSRAADKAEVLNAFSYTGAFGACAASTGARRIVSIDSSQPALDMAQATMSLNGLEAVSAEYTCADVFQQLRVYRAEARAFDLIILDPPKFAHSGRDMEQAARGYKDINLLAFQLLKPGGSLLTFSCSGLVDADLFQKIVFAASLDAGRQAQIIGWFGHPPDHPVLLAFPEGRYLKGLVCRVAGF